MGMSEPLESALQHFRTHGWMRIERAFSDEAARLMRDEPSPLWPRTSPLRQFGHATSVMLQLSGARKTDVTSQPIKTPVTRLSGTATAERAMIAITVIPVES